MLIINAKDSANSAVSSHVLPLLACLLLLGISPLSLAELEELDDEKLEELRGKEGITIDLSYKLSIGEIAWQFNDQELDEDRRKNSLPPTPPRIEYHVNGN